MRSIHHPLLTLLYDRPLSRSSKLAMTPRRLSAVRVPMKRQARPPGRFSRFSINQKSIDLGLADLETFPDSRRKCPKSNLRTIIRSCLPSQQLFSFDPTPRSLPLHLPVQTGLKSGSPLAETSPFGQPSFPLFTAPHASSLRRVFSWPERGGAAHI